MLRAEHVLRDVPPVVQRVVPCPHAVVALRDDIVELGDIARGPHVRDVRLEELVREHADVRLEGGALEDVDVHREAEPNRDEVRRSAEALRAGHLGLPVLRREPLDRLLVVEVHAGILCEERDDLATWLVERAPQEPRPALDPVRLELAEGEGLRQLVADERPAHDDGDLRVGDARDHRLRLIEVLEVEEVFRAFRAGDLERVRAAAGRDEQPVVRELTTGIQRDRLLLEVHVRDLRLEAQVDAVLLVPGHVAHVHPLLEKHAPEVPRERDAVVERVLLVVDHHDLGRDIVLADLLGRVRAGRAVADDHEASGG